jgi:hypothetical protein
MDLPGGKIGKKKKKKKTALLFYKRNMCRVQFFSLFFKKLFKNFSYVVS